MAIDASIYGQIRQPQAYNPLAEMAQFQQYQGLQNQNKLAELGFQDRERQQADQTRLRGIYGQGLQGDGLENALLQGGFANESLKFGADRRANAKTDAETQSKQLETAVKRTEAIGQGLGYLKDNPSIENAQSLISSWVQSGLMPSDVGQQKLADFQRDPSPQGIQRLALQGYQGALSAKDQLATFSTRNLGATTETTAINPVTGEVKVVNAAPNTISPDARLQADTSTQNNLRSTSATRDLAQSNRDSANIQTGFKNEQDLRKEFEGLPEIKNYKQAYPAYAAVKDAAARNTPQADINLVYGIAKLYDPNSVVREGEYATVANSPNIPERVKGYAQYLAGGGKLSPETKRQILAEAEGRVQTYKAEADKARASYTLIAQQRGIKPESIFPAMGAAPAGAMPSAQPISSKAQFDALPSGAEFIAPDGSHRRKP